MTRASEERCFKCVICLEDDIPWSRRTTKKIIGCRRHDRLCKPCAALHIAASVDQGRAPVCPIPSCSKTFNSVGCKDIVTIAVLDEWHELLCRAAIRRYISCVCPNPECRELIINECGFRLPLESDGNVDCPSCLKGFCFMCGGGWEKGSAHRCVDPILDVIRNNRWVRCPGCKFYVERIQGCIFIRCRCNTYFCYRCGLRVADSTFHRCANGRQRQLSAQDKLGFFFLAFFMLLVIFQVFWAFSGIED